MSQAVQSRTRSRQARLIGPAGCGQYNCNRMWLSGSGNLQRASTQVLKHIALTIAVVAVCWSYWYL